MIKNLLDKIGDWNPQFLREIKGRLQQRNIILAITVSLLGQFLLFMYFQAQLPDNSESFPSSNKYCTGKILYGMPECLQDEFGNLAINWQLLWLNLFTLLSIIGCYSLLVAGTYLLISNLATEERRDTLNFIRLSPQSPQTILVGKILGVPILVYITLALAIPLHLWSGLAADIPLELIFCFYAVIFAACLFYYSAALLFGLVGSWLSGFQAWLGSGVVLGFLILTKEWLSYNPVDYPLVLLRFFNPYFLIPHLSLNSASKSIYSSETFHWFALPIGASFTATVALTILNYIVLTSFAWQALQRCFSNPNATMLSKKQSYLLTSYFTVLTIGCANWHSSVLVKDSHYSTIRENLSSLFFLHFWLFLYLIAAISPHRQTLIDWARYRHFSGYKSFWNSHTIKDLIWGEKSPAWVAIALNAMIVIFSLSLLVFFTQNDTNHKINGIYALVLAGSLAMIYAALTQLMLFMKTQHRIFWTAATLGAVIVLPVIILALLFNNPNHATVVWLFSVIAPLIALYPTGASLSLITVLFAILVQEIILGGLIFSVAAKIAKSRGICHKSIT
ncbi:hypothetical protein ACF3DV_17085 [Chlorogloeopsis fritschii PCC 9212]|uniref:Uncharacterized protein n=1 Tax=Chlorogloeopsis fritschii PCC 6912 TaxID=211165 RepID=A0A3S1A3Y2_CHLFR|nr:hypothetical protein [Chlorogloeopsis fritschii]RUR85057.1 hypothetical protein PCC6912_11730 [Chlorogloeopsis fritschii PCC 6912]